MKTNRLHGLLIGMVLGWLVFALPQARANIYATHLRLNNQTNNAAVLRGGGVSVNYILNEPATAGVLLEIFSGTNIVRSISITNGNPGALRGTNTIVWDGKDGSSNDPPAGEYQFRITAAANGFDVWTQTSDDTNQGNHVLSPKGIAVNRNTNSFFYGRVFVGNAPNIEPPPGAEQGIYKLNADGSFVEEGWFSNGGYAWSSGSFRAYSPWKVEVSSDDKVYVNDWSDNGIVMVFDQLITTNNYSLVLRSDNWPSSGLANLSGPFITGAGTNTQVWMCDVNYTSPTPGVGVVRWNVTDNGTLATNDMGTTIVQARWPSDLNLYPYDVAVDKDGKIYTIQYRQVNDASPRVLRFPKHDEGTDPETVADWKTGAGDETLQGLYGIAVNPEATFVAVAIRGLFNGSTFSQGGLAIFNASNGVLITNISVATDHDHTDVTWDNVGNVYDCDNFDGRWRVYSPPGNNQATTVALEIIQILDQFTQPQLSPIGYSSNQFQCTLLGQSNVTYAIQSSTNLLDWTSILTNYNPSSTRQLTLPALDDQNYYRAVVLP